MQFLDPAYFANVADTGTNYERFKLGWSSNVFEMRVEKGGSGTARNTRIYFGGSSDIAAEVGTAISAGLTLSSSSSSSAVTGGRVVAGGSVTATSGTSISVKLAETYAPTSTSTMVGIGLQVSPTINYSAGTPGAGSYEALKIAVTETANPTGTNYLIRASAGSAGTTDKFAVKNTGTIVGTIGTITSNTPFLDLTATWNANVAFTGIAMDVSVSLTGGGTTFINLKNSGVSKFSVGLGGEVTCKDVTASGAGAFSTSFSVGTDLTVTGDANFAGNKVRLRTTSSLGEVFLDRLAFNGATGTLTNILYGTVTYNPPSIASGAGAGTTVTVTGAVVGDFVIVTFSNSLQGMQLTGYVSGADAVGVRFQNVTAGTLDLASGTLGAIVIRVV